MIRVLVADDHAIVRQCLCRTLALAPDLLVAGEAKDGWEVIEQVRNHSFDLLLLDMNIPGPSGVELIKRVRMEAPQLPVLVLSMHDESRLVGRAIRAGAGGYLTKDSELETLLAAVRKVAAGSHAIDPVLASRIVFESGDVPHGNLTEREYEVFLMLARGQSVKSIAAALHLSPKTVSTHKCRLLPKLGAQSVSDLVRYALRHGLLEECPPGGGDRQFFAAEQDNYFPRMAGPASRP